MIINVPPPHTPIQVGQGTLSKEIPVISSSFVFASLANDVFLDGGVRNVIGRINSLVLLALFLIFCVYTFAIARAEASPKSKSKELSP